jgi:hypothetical protein
MDPTRALRLTIAPIVFAAFICWSDALTGKYGVLDYLGLGSSAPKQDERQGTASKAPEEHKIIGTLIAAGGLLLALGYALSSLTIAVVRPLSNFEEGTDEERNQIEFLLRKSGATNDAAGTNDGMDESWRTKPSRVWWNYAKSARVVFHHAILIPRLHAWIDRRWNTMMVSLNCLVALIGALLVELVVSADQSRYYLAMHSGWWILTWAVFVSVFAWNAYAALHEVREMTRYCLRFSALATESRREK